MGTKSGKTEICTCNTEDILLYGHLASPKDFLRLMMVPLLRRLGFFLCVLKEFNQKDQFLK